MGRRAIPIKRIRDEVEIVVEAIKELPSVEIEAVIDGTFIVDIDRTAGVAAEISALRMDIANLAPQAGITSTRKANGEWNFRMIIVHTPEWRRLQDKTTETTDG